MTITVEQTRKFVSAANVALTAAVVIAGLVLARDTVLLAGFGSSNVDEAKKTEAVASDYSRTLPFREYAPVVENNVFGIKAGKLTPISRTALVPQKSEKAAPGQRPLQVFGTVAWDGGFGYAFIKNPKGKQSVVKTGQDIPGSGRLERVYADHIVISINNKEFEVNTLQVSPPKDFAAPKKKKDAKPGNGFARQTGEGEYVVDRIAVEESISNPKRLLTDARMLPHFNEQKVQVGFVLSEVKPGGVYHTLGLKNKDIVLGVNGLKLSNPESALEAFSALKGTNRISVDIIRSGNPMTLKYNLR